LPPTAASGASDLAETVPPHPLPQPVTTEHILNLPGRTLRFKATVGAIRLSDAQSGAPIADIGYKAYRLEGPDLEHKRPLTIALNGGPGASSAWLDLGAIGPWRLPIDPTNISPSMPATVVDNADTWLDFTDLLFIDPLGTGYSRMIGKNDEADKTFYGVKGDIDALSTVIRKWLVANDRQLGPKFIVGESYGGFRAPKLAKKLEQAEGVGIDGIIMISPVLDFAWFSPDDNPAVYAARLPSLVAAATEVKGGDPRGKLGEVEAYAAGPYLLDLYKGLHDAEARRRMAMKVATFTGLDEKFVERLAGRVDASTMTREMHRADAKIASAYDTSVLGYDLNPFDETSRQDDPVLDALKVPLASAMADITAKRLGWPVNARYEILNGHVNERWDWGNARHPLESISDLAALLSLDGHFRALAIHGVKDQVTPYFTTKMLIDQMPVYGDDTRLRLVVYNGGHMPYLEGEARSVMHEDARRMIVGERPIGPQ
jgi:carboxypeptidase C (cathepsin A)